MGLLMHFNLIAAANKIEDMNVKKEKKKNCSKYYCLIDASRVNAVTIYVNKQACREKFFLV